MIGEPEAGEAVLGDYHAQSHHHGVGDAQLIIAAKAVATEDGATVNGL